MEISVYQMAVNNTALYIRSQVIKDGGDTLDAFTASVVLAVAFCKTKEEVLADILSVGGLPARARKKTNA